MARANASIQVVLEVALGAFAAVRNTAIACSYLTWVAAAGFAQAVSDTTIVHGIGGKSCGEYLSAVSDRAPGTGVQMKQADGEYFDAAHVQSEWLAGFMTTMNMLWSEPAMQITADAAAIDAWIRNWCEHNPTGVLVHAAAAYVREQFLTQLSKPEP
jgi:hypothetical protein